MWGNAAGEVVWCIGSFLPQVLLWWVREIANIMFSGLAGGFLEGNVLTLY